MPTRSLLSFRGRTHSIFIVSRRCFSSSHMDLYSTVRLKSRSSRQVSWLLSQATMGCPWSMEKFRSSNGLLL